MARSFDTGEDSAKMLWENAEVINSYLSLTSCTLLSRTAASEQTPNRRLIGLFKGHVFCLNCLELFVLVDSSPVSSSS